MIFVFLLALFASTTIASPSGYITLYGDVHKDVEFFTRTYPWIIDNIGGHLYVEYHLLGSGRYSVPQACALADLISNTFLQAQYLRCEAKGYPSEYCLCEAGIEPQNFKQCVASGGFRAGSASARFSELGINFSPIIDLGSNNTVFGVDDISLLKKICTIYDDDLPRGCIHYSNQTDSFLKKRALAQFDRACHKEFPIDDDTPEAETTSKPWVTPAPTTPDWGFTTTTDWPWFTTTTTTARPWVTPTTTPDWWSTTTTRPTELPTTTPDWWSTTPPWWWSTTTKTPWWCNTQPSDSSTTSPTLSTTSSPWSTISPPWSTTSPPWATRPPPFSTTSPPWSTTSPPWSTTPPQFSTTSPPRSTTSPPWSTTSPSWFTTSTPQLPNTTPRPTRPTFTSTSPPRSTTSPPWSTTSPSWITTSTPQLPTTTPRPTRPTLWPTWWPTRTTLRPTRPTLWPTKATPSYPPWVVNEEITKAPTPE